jgi:hypothetical protein
MKKVEKCQNLSYLANPNVYETKGKLLESDGNGLARQGTTFYGAIDAANEILGRKSSLENEFVSFLDLRQGLLCYMEKRMVRTMNCRTIR